MLLPLGFVAGMGVQAGWQTVLVLVVRPRVGELLVNVVALVVLTLPLATALALALAWLTERSDIPGARLWSALAVAPLAVPAFLHGYAWVSLFPSFHGLGAAVLLSVIAYAPFLYLPIAAMLRRLDPGLEDSAGSLGLPPWRVFTRVVLPQLRLAICGGALLVGLHLLAEYGLYGMLRFDTFTTAILDQYQSAFNGVAANMLAAVLVLLSLTLLGGEALLRGTARYARLGGGAPRPATRTPLGRLTHPCLAALVLLQVAALGVPGVTILRWLVAGGGAVWQAAEIGPALASTAELAILGAVTATLLSVPMAWLSVRAPSRLQRVLEASNYVVGALPGVVTALALVTLAVTALRPLYQTTFTIVLAYALMFLPRTMLSLRAGLAQAPVELEHAAASLGRSPLRAVWAVTARLAAPGAAAGLAMVALGITNELTATQMLAPIGTETLATRFWSYTGELDYASAAPYALIMVLLSIPMTWLLYVHSKRTAGR
ncbi:MAG: iron ABC transporter permease [Rhodospirillales bacterium]|nr:iron ABC transporter permease [Rhodospirillales bacterium]